MHFWSGRATHPGPPSQLRHVSLEFGWLTHGDLALDAGVAFLAIAEHRLIPARVCSEWSRLRGKGLSSIWAPASQDSSHVGNAGVGVVSLRGAPWLKSYSARNFQRATIMEPTPANMQSFATVQSVFLWAQLKGDTLQALLIILGVEVDDHPALSEVIGTMQSRSCPRLPSLRTFGDCDVCPS